MGPGHSTNLKHIESRDLGPALGGDTEAELALIAGDLAFVLDHRCRKLKIEQTDLWFVHVDLRLPNKEKIFLSIDIELDDPCPGSSLILADPVGDRDFDVDL